jgi:ferredoxin
MIARKIVLKFPQNMVDEPIVCGLVKRYDLEFNILKAHVTPKEEGRMVLEIKGEKDSFDDGMQYLKDVGVGVQPLSLDIVRDDDRCIHCGACTAVCPSGALALDRQTWMVNFNNERCIACELCIKACPVRVMEVHF